jgi:hypothetical protein
MNKIRRIDSFFEKKRKNIDNSQPSESTPMCNVEVMVEQPQCASVYEEPALINEQPPTRIDIAHLIRDPSNRPQIWEYPVNQQDEIRRAYINLGPYQPLMSEYPLTGKKHPRRFQSHWFKSYPWLEYSEKNTAFCFPCYLFPSKPSGKPGSDTFTVKGFNCWKKVNDGERCAFLTHMEKRSKFSS